MAYDTFESLRVSEEDAYQLLANAIVKDAADCYRTAYKALCIFKTPVLRRAAQIELDKETAFFNSEFYTLLTTADPEYIMNRIRREVDKEIAETHSLD